MPPKEGLLFYQQSATLNVKEVVLHYLEFTLRSTPRLSVGERAALRAEIDRYTQEVHVLCRQIHGTPPSNVSVYV